MSAASSKSRSPRPTHYLVAVLVFFGFYQRAFAQLKQYETRYYTIYTDIDPDDEKEAAIRMTKMAEEYHERTRSFSGIIRTKFPFYLFKSAADYYRAGGIQGSAGVFIFDQQGSKLMAIAGEKTSQNTWHVVQHEGFHQFAHAVIGGDMPIWLNEGLAEYFGESIFTGDGFVTGVIPPWRLTRLKTEIADKKLLPLNQMMALSTREWQEQLNIRNYDQAWSMVHFLVQADNQKYQQPFSDCIRSISNGSEFSHAWTQTIGSTDGFETRWNAWWISQPERPTNTLYGHAAVATMTSFVARAFAQKQVFTDFDAFKSAASNNQIKISPDDWLPMSLLTNTLRLYGQIDGWSIKPAINRQPTVGLVLEDGTRLTGSFELRNNRVQHVNVDIDTMAIVLMNAQSLVKQNKIAQARSLVNAALIQHPNSALASEAKQFMVTTR